MLSSKANTPMKLRRCLLAVFLFAMPTAVIAEERPNIIVVLADDLGRGDYSAFGTPDICTPNIDRLFHEGATFDNLYANSCVCSPTRAAPLTGCYPDRVGVPGVIRHVPTDSWGYLSPQATLLPQSLKAAGYHSAIVGKWHLGLEAPNTPCERGFDLFHGFLGDMMDDYHTHLRGGHNFMRRNAQVIEPEGHATDLFSDWACEYLAERAKSGGPFFLYLAYNAPHDPIQPPTEWLAKVTEREPRISEKRAKLVALIEHFDAGLGRVLNTLDRLQLTENTLVVFTSDNGGLLESGANNGSWRNGKTHMYEGGLRVPGAARWPGHIKAGSHVEHTALTMDIFATLCEAAGVAATGKDRWGELSAESVGQAAGRNRSRPLFCPPRGRAGLWRQDRRSADSGRMETTARQPVRAARALQSAARSCARRPTWRRRNRLCSGNWTPPCASIFSAAARCLGRRQSRQITSRNDERRPTSLNVEMHSLPYATGILAKWMAYPTI